MKYAVSITKGNDPRPFWTKIVSTEVDAERVRRKNQWLIDKHGWDHSIVITELAAGGVTVGRISATRQGSTPGVAPSLTLRGFHGAVPHTPSHERLWPAAADVLCDELAKIREALLVAKTLLDSPKDDAAQAALARLLGDLEIT